MKLDIFKVKGENQPILQRRLLREDIKKYLLDAIINGELHPGERLVETRIAKKLKVSQAPVREAIRELESIGLVENRPYQGTFIRKLTRKQVEEAYEVRKLLEEAAARRAAKFINAEHISRLAQLVEEMREAAHQGLRSVFVEKDIDFHALIFKVAQNELLYEIWSNVRLGSFTEFTTHLSKRTLPDLAERHNSILEALKAGDADLAATQAGLHIAELAEEILKKIP
ncbi:MAG: GntR family transcriptional regulator [Clostridia bacterium]|nr:GntR family transcriptional regulator [Clostridia bacterium]